MLGVEPRASYMQSKRSPAELHPLCMGKGGGLGNSPHPPPLPHCPPLTLLCPHGPHPRHRPSGHMLPALGGSILPTGTHPVRTWHRPHWAGHGCHRHAPILLCSTHPWGRWVPKRRARPGVEPGTSRTQSENHTPRPTSRGAAPHCTPSRCAPHTFGGLGGQLRLRVSLGTLWEQGGPSCHPWCMEPAAGGGRGALVPSISNSHHLRGFSSSKPPPRLLRRLTWPVLCSIPPCPSSSTAIPKADGPL